jgi:hypothetical protein
MSGFATFTSGLLLAATLGPPGDLAGDLGDSVPVQRPAMLDEAAPQPADDALEGVGEGDDAIAAPVTTLGRIEGIATDAEADDRPVPGATVELLCPCLSGSLTTSTDEEGRFTFSDLPAGEYTIFVDRGGEVASTLVALPGGAHRSTSLSVAPPFTTELLDRERRQLDRGRAMIAVGGVAAVTAVLMFISAGVEAAKPQCRFGPDACENPPRPALIGSLAGIGGVLSIGSAVLIVAGVRKIRRVDARLQLDGRSAAVTVTGRF